MRVLEGQLPEDKSWRTLVILAPGEELGLTWQLGLSLAMANSGDLVTAVILPTEEEPALSQARESLAAVESYGEDDTIFAVLILADNFEKAVRELIHKADIDLLLARADAPSWHSLERMPCAIAAVRGEAYSQQNGDQESDEKLPRFKGHILAPTAGGPNSIHALRVLLPLTSEDVQVTALFIAPEHLGPSQEALGEARLRQTIEFVEGQERIQKKLITTPSIIQGIVSEASGDYQLVIIGASRESSLDKILFGDIVGTVVRESRTPVVVFRQPSSRWGSIFTGLDWSLQRIIPRLNRAERSQAYVHIRRDARPGIDFFVLIGLSAAIAAFGLLSNSAAVVIGAMLVAPLMSPIAGSGLAMVQGDMRFLRLSTGAVLKGTLTALIMGLLVGVLPIQDPFTPEVLARTAPRLLDLGIALLSGMAVAYALCRTSALAALPGVSIAAALVPPIAAAGICLANGAFALGLGALLLFTTNFIAISVASAFVFLVLGFRPLLRRKDRREARARSAQAAAVLLVIITALLAWTGTRLAQESAFESEVHHLVENAVVIVTSADFDEMEMESMESGGIQINLVVRSPVPISRLEAVELQRYLASEIDREVKLVLTVIDTEVLDASSFPAD